MKIQKLVPAIALILLSGTAMSQTYLAVSSGNVIYVGDVAHTYRVCPEVGYGKVLLEGKKEVEIPPANCLDVNGKDIRNSGSSILDAYPMGY